MGFETRELTGQLFKNQEKTTDRQPNASGEAMINGVLYKVSAWTKKDKNGAPWQSLSFQVKEARPTQTGPNAYRQAREGAVPRIPDNPEDDFNDPTNKVSKPYFPPEPFDDDVPF